MRRGGASGGKGLLHAFKLFASRLLAVMRTDFTGPAAAERVLYSFATPAEISSCWRVSSDSSFGGGSYGTLEATGKGTSVFKGHISMDTRGTTMRQAGYVAMLPTAGSPTSPHPPGVTNLAGFDGIEIRAKTDGRMYVANVKVDSVVKNHLYQAFFTGPKGIWTNIVLPFDKFTLTFQGMVEAEHVPIEPELFQAVSILSAERKEGDFEIEIEWIKAINTRLHKGSRYTGLHYDITDHA